MKKIYTKVGDSGTTVLNGEKVRKDDCQIEALGSVDALLASIDKCIYGLDILPEMQEHIGNLKYIVDVLKDLASTLAGRKIVLSTNEADVAWLEELIDETTTDVFDFVRFLNPVAMDIDETRIRTRKVERDITKFMRENVVSDESYAFINRLSDYFFVLAIYVDTKFE